MLTQYLILEGMGAYGPLLLAPAEVLGVSNFLQNSILRTFLTFLIILMVSTTKMYAPSTLSWS